jgi:Uma2 family endonuclease
MLSPDQIEPQRFRPLSRKEYDQLVELGGFDEDDRFELLRGWLVTMTPQSSPHADVTRRLDRSLNGALGDRAIVSCQFPFAATDDSEPEPDIAVVPVRDYADGHPTEAFLIIEVAYASVKIDLGVKPSVYAEAAVPEYWVVNLPDDAIEVFTDPTPDGYRGHRRAVRGERIRLLAFPDVELDVDAILPKR